jgi:hypothetical protein
MTAIKYKNRPFKKFKKKTLAIPWNGSIISEEKEIREADTFGGR